MSTGRGPGFIGMLMALVVLAGFGLLYVFVLDAEASQGASVETIIKNQEYDIEAYKAQIADYSVVTDTIPIIEEISSKLETLKKSAPEREAKVATLRENLSGLEKSFKDTAAAFTSYKEQYRSMVRNKAVGEQLEQLALKSGNVYKKVEIREVSSVGIQIRHEDGQKRVPFEELPEEMQERFQFDSVEKDKQLAQELENLKRHEGLVDPAPESAPGKDVAESKGTEEGDAARKKQIKKAINDMEIRIARARTEYSVLHSDASMADADAADGRRNSRTVANRSAGIRAKMQAKQSEISALMRQLAALKSAR
jgi:hypothetical protein